MRGSRRQQILGNRISTLRVFYVFARCCATRVDTRLGEEFSIFRWLIRSTNCVDFCWKKRRGWKKQKKSSSGPAMIKLGAAVSCSMEIWMSHVSAVSQASLTSWRWRANEMKLSRGSYSNRCRWKSFYRALWLSVGNFLVLFQLIGCANIQTTINVRRWISLLLYSPRMFRASTSKVEK